MPSVLISPPPAVCTVHLRGLPAALRRAGHVVSLTGWAGDVCDPSGSGKLAQACFLACPSARPCASARAYRHTHRHRAAFLAYPPNPPSCPACVPSLQQRAVHDWAAGGQDPQWCRQRGHPRQHLSPEQPGMRERHLPAPSGWSRAASCCSCTAMQECRPCFDYPTVWCIKLHTAARLYHIADESLAPPTSLTSPALLTSGWPFVRSVPIRAALRLCLPATPECGPARRVPKPCPLLVTAFFTVFSSSLPPHSV